MASNYTDYILFIHGVNTRQNSTNPDYANKLIGLLKNEFKNHSPELQIKPISLYWGDVNKDAENSLLGKLNQSPTWQNMWFRKMREQQIMQFAGDAALYISRQIGSRIVEKLKDDAVQGLKNRPSEARLHLVTHSWGTVILFDILFASRWEDLSIPAYESVQSIRRQIYGISPEPEQGICLASIHTMGSPVSLFSLLDVTKGEDQAQGKSESKYPNSSSHDITPELEKFLASLGKSNGGMKLPWNNFMHPGDPIAYPLEIVISSLVDGEKRTLNIQDILIPTSGFSDFLSQQFSQSPLPLLLNGGNAHGSYWESQTVAQKIAETIKQQSLIGVKPTYVPNSAPSQRILSRIGL